MATIQALVGHFFDDTRPFFISNLGIGQVLISKILAIVGISGRGEFVEPLAAWLTLPIVNVTTHLICWLRRLFSTILLNAEESSQYSQCLFESMCIASRGRPKPIYAHLAVTVTWPKLRFQLRL